MINCKTCGKSIHEDQSFMSEYGQVCGGCHDTDDDTYHEMGSVGLGFVIGLLTGCIGLIIVLAVAKGSETKRGAGIGFAVQIVAGIAIRILGS